MSRYLTICMVTFIAEYYEEYKCVFCLLLDVVKYLDIATKLAAVANLVGHALPLSNISVA